MRAPLNVRLARRIVNCAGRSAIAVILLVAALAAPGRLPAQVIHGRITGAGGAPVAGAIVTLLDSAGGAASRTMSDTGGSYRIAVTRPGAWRVRAQRIGYRPATSAAVRVVDEDVQVPLGMAPVALTLDAIRVAERSVCGNVGDSTGATFALWEQIRTALLAAQVTSRTRGLDATVVIYERVLEPQTRRVQDQQARVSSGFVTEPWRSAPIPTLRREGYVVEDAQGWTVYRVPGLDVLLSDAFVEDHCFKVVQPRDRTRRGIAFEPTRDRRGIPEVRGTIWLERSTHALRSMEFRYANIAADQAAESGGEVHFAQLRDGGWAVAQWHVDMPVFEEFTASGRRERRVAELRTAGGDLSVATRGGDTLWARSPIAVSGVVLDSASRSAIARARVALAGAGITAVTDDRGRFTLPAVLPAAYTLLVSADTARPPYATSVVLVEGGAPLQVRVPRATTVLAGGARTTLAGMVIMDSLSRPLAGAEVSLPVFSRSTTSAPDGSFQLNDVPNGEHRVTVRRVGYAPLDTMMTFPGGTVTWRAALRQAQVLDTVSVRAASVIPSFDEHRALKRGHFITRAELAKMESRPMSAVLADLPSVRLVPMQGSGGSVVATRRRSSATFRRIDQADTRRILEQGFCPATVYLNNALAYSGGPGEPPFNINTFAPQDIEAIEYYASANEVPPRYAGRNVECGVLVVHTRRGRR